MIPTKDTIFAIFKIDEPHLAIMSDVDNIIDFQQLKSQADKLIRISIAEKGGNILGENNGALVAALPIHTAETILDIYSQIHDDYDLTVTVGVGETVDEAAQTLEYALKNFKGLIKVHGPYVHEEVKPGSALPPQKIAEGQQDKPIHKSEEDTKKPLTDETKKKVAGLLNILQSQKEFFDNLKQTRPEVYQGVVGIVQSLVSIIKSHKEAEQAESVKQLIETASKESEENADKQEGQIVEALMHEYDRQKEEEKAKRDHSLQMHNDGNKRALAQAEPTAKKYGLDKRFLARLIR